MILKVFSTKLFLTKLNRLETGSLDFTRVLDVSTRFRLTGTVQVVTRCTVNSKQNLTEPLYISYITKLALQNDRFFPTFLNNIYCIWQIKFCK